MRASPTGHPTRQSGTPRIDHVILGARSIAPLRDLLWEEYGFGVTDGSPNPDGTASWVVPFDSADVQYLELLVPGDERQLAATDFGRLFLDRTAAGPVFLNWAVLVEDIAAAADRVQRLTGQDPEMLRGESVRADGQRVPWAEAAFAASWATPSHPFFLEYGNWAARRARVAGDIAAAGHRCRPVSIDRLAVRTARNDLDSWLGVPEPPVTVVHGTGEAIIAATVRTDAGPVELRVPGGPGDGTP
ncbi:VOC family protein [Actinomadura craniellae]|uniref:VOC family protein n=1 Tax=Actinomadura craniellae TaxID=2231787 RepID=A0A365HAP2_9ACTN|nr:VOC family protein [Actinomadura craniellae]RAY16151.1 VOC family protein [Actinomadura craniellae]